MNIWKKILGISLAVSLSVGMSIAPVYADTISILDEITDEETTEDFAEDTSTILARSSYLNLGNVKIHKISSNKTIDVAVPSGTYYRVRGYHAASQSGTKESTSTLTSGIMVK